MGRIERVKTEIGNRAQHLQLAQKLQKQNERWWIAGADTFCFGLMMLPIERSGFTTTKLLISMAGAIGYLLLKLVTHRRKAPLTRWRNLSAAAFAVGTVWILLPAGLLLFDGEGNRENMYWLLCCAPFGWLLFAYCRLQIRRIRRRSAEAIERIRREQRRRRRLELLEASDTLL